MSGSIKRLQSYNKCMYACMHVCSIRICMHVNMYFGTYVCMYVCTYIWIHKDNFLQVCVHVYVCCAFVCRNVCKKICMYVCMYVCMYESRKFSKPLLEWSYLASSIACHVPRSPAGESSSPQIFPVLLELSFSPNEKPAGLSAGPLLTWPTDWKYTYIYI